MDKVATRIANLEAELKLAREKIKELTTERDEADELAAQAREHVEDCSQMFDHWVEIFEMQQNEHGLWVFDADHTKLWEAYDDLLTRHKNLVSKWNKFVSQYNSIVVPRDRGRPLAASEAQRVDVLKRRKGGASLRKIAAAASLSLSTVRTICDKPEGRGRVAQHHSEVRRLEFDRLRAAEYRSRKRGRDDLPKRIGELQKAGAALLKASKGLGR